MRLVIYNPLFKKKNERKGGRRKKKAFGNMYAFPKNSQHLDREAKRKDWMQRAIKFKKGAFPPTCVHLPP